MAYLDAILEVLGRGHKEDAVLKAIRSASLKWEGFGMVPISKIIAQLPPGMDDMKAWL